MPEQGPKDKVFKVQVRLHEIDGKAYFLKSDVEDFLAEVNKINHQQQEEIMILQELKRQELGLLRRFLRWLNAYSTASFEIDEILDSWERNKDEFEIEEAGGRQ